MKEKPSISITEFNKKVETFKNDMNTVSKQNIDISEQQINDIQLDTQFMLLKSEERPKERIEIHSETNKKHFKNKKIYFDSNESEIKIGYNDETGIGFIEIIDKN